MKCLRLFGRQESCQFSYENNLLYSFVIESLYLLCLSAAFCVTLDFKLFIDSIHILFLLYLLPWLGFSTSKPAGFHQNI